jgi:signal transduction histidine kinase
MRSLSLKLTFAFLLVAVTAAVLVATALRLTSPERFNNLLREQARSELVRVLANYYTANNSFDGLAAYLQTTGYLAPPPPQNSPQGQIANAPPPNRLVFAIVDERGIVILSIMRDVQVGATAPANLLQTGDPVQVNGRVVATIIMPPDPFTLTPQEQSYLDRTNQAIWLAALGAVVVALIVGILLARTLAHPLRDLTSAAHRMADGDLEQEVPVRSKDEIGELAQAFNTMSHSVARANQLRRQMTADIAHDLRTPLTVIAGYIESMRKGVLAPSPERLDLINTEIEHLQKMVEDLRTLSRADAGELTLNRQAIDPRVLLEQTASTFRYAAEQKGISIDVIAPQAMSEIFVDEARMAQVLGNLVSNALRFTPAGGRINLLAEQRADSVMLTIRDTGKGIPTEDLPHIFERFYRADKSRSDSDNASGLGLAITRALVVAHGGSIRAESAAGAGTSMIISLKAKTS